MLKDKLLPTLSLLKNNNKNFIINSLKSNLMRPKLTILTMILLLKE